MLKRLGIVGCMKLTKSTRELILHRLGMTDTIAACLADTDDIGCTEAEAQSAADRVLAAVERSDEIDLQSLPKLDLEVLIDAIDGSTAFADIEDMIFLKACGMTRGKFLSMKRAASEIEKSVLAETGRRVSFPDY
jgi:hypothetical protein